MTKPKPVPRHPVGRFRCTPWGRPMTAILDRDLSWMVVPIEPDGSEEESKVIGCIEGALNGVHGQETARVMLSGVRGQKYYRLFYDVMAALGGTDGELLPPPPDPPGTVH
jgi:hypothetical protein